MIFQDTNGNKIIQLDNFYKRYDSSPIFIETDVQVISSETCIKQQLEFELSDFYNLKNYLEKVDIGMSKYFTFQNLEEQFKVSFEAIDLYFLKLEGFLKDKMYLSELKFSFEMPIKEIPELVNSIDNLIIKHSQF